MERMGYKSSSVGSLLAQFAKQGLAERDDRGRYITIVDEYKPLKTPKKKLTLVPKPAETKRKYERKATTGIGALLREKLENATIQTQDALDAAAYAMGTHEPVHKRVATIIRAQQPDDIIKNLSVFQARDLYDRLKQIFGG
jgi:xylose isomerase